MLKPENIAIIGGGAIGTAFSEELIIKYPDSKINIFSRKPVNSSINSISHHLIDYDDISSIHSAAELASSERSLDLVLVATGILHDEHLRPEKSLRDLSSQNFETVFKVNTIVPALIAKYFLPILSRNTGSVFAALSARVGSISDNQLGGWYAYRASKSALNMIIKSASIEVARKNPEAIVVGLHPGTVDSNLSKPFQHSVDANKLFTPEYAAQKMLLVLDCLTPSQTGKCFAWDGSEILP